MTEPLGTGQIRRLTIPADLVRGSLEYAVNEYRKHFDADPIGIIIQGGSVAREAAKDISVGILPKEMLVYAVPFLPEDSWLLYGREGIIISEGV